MKQILEKQYEQQNYNFSPDGTLAGTVSLEFHAQFEKIHPFQDGNGRTGRMILFKECLRSGVMPFIIGDDRKAEYYEALNHAQQKEDFVPLTQYFRQEQERYVTMVEGFICPVDSYENRKAEERLWKERHLLLF